MDIIKELHIITTGCQEIKVFASIAADIQEYVDYFHLREHSLTAIELYNAVELLISKGIPLSKIIINDRVDVAYAVKAAGVQLGFKSLQVKVVRESFPDLRIGCSTHSLIEAKTAFQNGADYAIFGHVFQTKSKQGLPPKGLKALNEIALHAGIPIIAIGGMDPSNIKYVLDAGASGVAVMSGVLEANDPISAVKQYSRIIRKGE